MCNLRVVEIENDVTCVIADDVVHAFNAVRAVEHRDVDGKFSILTKSCERFQIKIEENNARSDAVFACDNFHVAESVLTEHILHALANICFVIARCCNRELWCGRNTGFKFAPKFRIAIVLGVVLARLNPINVLRIILEVKSWQNAFMIKR